MIYLNIKLLKCTKLNFWITLWDRTYELKHSYGIKKTKLVNPIGSTPSPPANSTADKQRLRYGDHRVNLNISLIQNRKSFITRRDPAIWDAALNIVVTFEPIIYCWNPLIIRFYFRQIIISLTSVICFETWWWKRQKKLKREPWILLSAKWTEIYLLAGTSFITAMGFTELQCKWTTSD